MFLYNNCFPIIVIRIVSCLYVLYGICHSLEVTPLGWIDNVTAPPFRFLTIGSGTSNSNRTLGAAKPKAETHGGSEETNHWTALWLTMTLLILVNVLLI